MMVDSIASDQLGSHNSSDPHAQATPCEAENWMSALQKYFGKRSPAASLHFLLRQFVKVSVLRTKKVTMKHDPTEAEIEARRV